MAMTPEQRATLKNDIQRDFRDVSPKIMECAEIGDLIQQEIAKGLSAGELEDYKKDKKAVRTAQVKYLAEHANEVSASAEIYVDNTGTKSYFSVGIFREAFMTAAQFTELAPETSQKVRALTIGALAAAKDYSDDLKTGKLKPFSKFED